MDPSLITLIWLIFGVVLMVAELAIPGLVVVFFGAAAILVSGIRWAFGLESLLVSLLLWGFFSGVLVMVMRRFAEKLVPSEHLKSYIEEDISAIGTLVEVLEDCDGESREGRIQYQGTQWPAVTLGGTIKAGLSARLISREGLTWTIETAEAIDQFTIEQEDFETRLQEALASDALEVVTEEPAEARVEDVQAEEHFVEAHAGQKNKKAKQRHL